jgi:hypothetical protein
MNMICHGLNYDYQRLISRRRTVCHVVQKPVFRREKYFVTACLAGGGGGHISVVAVIISAHYA